MQTSRNIAKGRAQRSWLLAIGPLVLLALMWWLASFTGADQGSAGADVAWILIRESWPSVLWLLAAAGFGWPMRSALVANSTSALPIQIALGVAALLFLDAVLGSLGVLQAGDTVGAWILTSLGCAIALVQFIRWLSDRPHLSAPSLLTWTCLPALAVLLVAACSAPGWLWSTEFGGYDALSYHLQLPREWFHLGAITPLEHNVYSFVPGSMEAAFYHLAILRGGEIEFVYASQLLHAMFAALTAWLVACTVKQVAGNSAGPIAAAFVLGTPWVIVVGSLAYNEMAAAMMLAAGLLVLADSSVSSRRCGIMVGLFAATAVTAKLTSVGFVALPLVLVLMLRNGRSELIGTLLTGAIAGLIVLLPWLIRNAIACGNPVFPFATSVFGIGHWSSEQVATWNQGHLSDATLAERTRAVWNQFLRFGIGSNPSPGEPWKLQWLMLPWLAIVGLIMGFTHASIRQWSVLLAIVLGVQIAFWLGFTHLQSRFLLPTVVPMSIAVALAIGVLIGHVKSAGARRTWTGCIAMALLGWCFAPAVIFTQERGGEPAAAIGIAKYFTGFANDSSAEVNSMFASAFVNRLDQADDRPSVLLLGEAAVLYFDAPLISYSTVWDRGELSRLMDEYPGQPREWARALREMGFEHLLINPKMLDRWNRSGWNDPRLTSEAMLEFAKNYCTLQREFPGGMLLYRLEPAPATTERTP